MIAILLVNAAVSLIVGVALLLAWRRHATQRFSRDLGWAFLVQAITPLAFMLWHDAPMPWTTLGAAALVTCAVGYHALLIGGVGHLAGRPLSRRAMLALVAGIGLVGAVALGFEPRLAQAITSSAQLAIGGVAATWLWRIGRPERQAGVLLILLACVHFGYAAFGDAALPVQASLAAVLRVALGMTLLYAAIGRSTAESRRLRENFARMVEHRNRLAAGQFIKIAVVRNPRTADVFEAENFRIADDPVQIGAELIVAVMAADRIQAAG